MRCRQSSCMCRSSAGRRTTRPPKEGVSRACTVTSSGWGGQHRSAPTYLFAGSVSSLALSESRRFCKLAGEDAEIQDGARSRYRLSERVLELAGDKDRAHPHGGLVCLRQYRWLLGRVTVGIARSAAVEGETMCAAFRSPWILLFYVPLLPAISPELCLPAQRFILCSPTRRLAS